MTRSASKLDAERAADRRSQVGSGDRSERIRTPKPQNPKTPKPRYVFILNRHIYILNYI